MQICIWSWSCFDCKQMESALSRVSDCFDGQGCFKEEEEENKNFSECQKTQIENKEYKM